MKLYDKLRETRIDMDIGQKELANVLEISQPQYSLYETGKRKLPAEMLPPICRYLEVSADYLLGLPAGMPRPR